MQQGRRRWSWKPLWGFLTLVAALGSAPADAQQFVTGDLYLLSNSLFTGGKGIVRIEPLAGGSSLLTNYSSDAKSTFTYDSFRDRLVYADGRTTGGIVAVDATGVSVDLAPTVATPRLVAAGVGGILYFVSSNSPYTLRYLDASNVAHDVLNAAGAASFQLASGNLYDEMIYDPGTNSLLFMTGTFAGVPPPCVTAGHTCAVKIPLTGSRTQVAGAAQFTDAEVSLSAEIVVGSGLAPSGKVLVVVDTNENGSEPRLQLLDPSSMTMSVFANVGTPQYLAGAIAAGTYSTTRSQAVILDYLASVLRGFTLGDNGSGSIFSNNLSGFLSRMVEIRPGVPTGVEQGMPRPSHLRLDPVLPNPVTTTARVSFAAPEPGAIRVTIHDVSGRVTRVLAKETSGAQPTSLVWDGRDDRGRLVRQGAYYVRLEARGESVVRKIAVVR